MLGGKFRASYRPLNDNIMNGRIRGVAGVVGCTSAISWPDQLPYMDLVNALVANNILVVQTGCAAAECAREGMMIPEFMEKAGDGLREVCEAVGIPPVLHVGSCVDNSRILISCSEIGKGVFGTLSLGVTEATGLAGSVGVQVGFAVSGSSVFLGKYESYTR